MAATHSGENTHQAVVAALSEPAPDAASPVRSPQVWPAYLNAALWGLGAGFATTTLAFYLVNSLGAYGLTASLLLAAPQLVGLARMLAIKFTGDRPFRKKFCVGAYIGSGLILAALPFVVAEAKRLEDRKALVLVVGIWCAYHLLEYLGTVTLWAWLRDLFPLEHRGALIGRRESWLDGGRMLGMLGCAALTGLGDPRQLGPSVYAQMAAIGAALFVLAAIPLIFLPGRLAGSEPAASGSAMPRFRLRDLLIPFLDPRLSRLLLYGCWFSFFNGATQLAQNRFVFYILDVAFATMLILRVGMTAGQAIVSPWLGKAIDRVGARPVLLVCQAIVALSMFGYLFATEETWWLIVFAWAGWIAYAGINVALPNLLLKLSPPGKAGSAIAGYFAITGLCFGLSTVVGGWIFDLVRRQEFQVMGATLDSYQYAFYVAVVTRVLGCFFIYAIEEPRLKTAVPTKG